MPTWEDIWPILLHLMAPAIGASLVTMLAFRGLGGKSFSPVATSLAVAAGVFVAGVVVNNTLSEQLPWQLRKDRPWHHLEIFQVFGWTLEGKPNPKTESPTDAGEAQQADAANEVPMPTSMTFWVGYLACLFMLAELLIWLCALPAGPGWAARTLLAFFAGRLLTPIDLRAEHFWLPWAMGLAILLEWAVLAFLARRWLDGTALASVALCLLSAGAFIRLTAMFPSPSEVAMVMGCSLAGAALVAWIWPSDTRPAIAAAVPVLPGLLLISWYETLDPEAPTMPPVTIVLAGLAPLALLPLTIPFLTRRQGMTRWLLGLALPLIPAATAIVLAMKDATPEM